MAGLGVVGILVGPGVARVQDGGVDARHSDRHGEAEERIGTELGVPEAAVEGGVQKRARRLDRHALAHPIRSEEHTSELQSLMRISYAVFCLKKKKKHQR